MRSKGLRVICMLCVILALPGCGGELPSPPDNSLAFTLDAETSSDHEPPLSESTAEVWFDLVDSPGDSPGAQPIRVDPPQNDIPRPDDDQPATLNDVENIKIPTPDDVVQIKFHDGQRIRLRPFDLNNPNSQLELVDLDGTSLRSTPARQLLEMVSGGQWARAHIPDEELLDLMRARAVELTGEYYPDLNLYFSLRLSPGSDREAIIAGFNQLDEVDRAYALPDLYLAVPVDYTDHRGTFDAGGQDFEYPYQKYLDPAPIGVDARYAWTIPGGRGEGVNVILVENYFNGDHLDLPDVVFDGIVPTYYTALDINHGTATLGVIAGLANDYGVTGIAHGAAGYYFVSANTAGQSEAVTWAIGLDGAVVSTLASENAQPGDVLVLELQTTGPVDFAPVEWHEQIFQAIRIATANGLVVIEAAGNGFQDLDDDIYLDDPDHPHNPFLVEASGERVNDSGAIMVGAAAADAQWKTYFSYQPGERLSFSNHGARVDVHAWGEAVVTGGNPRNIPLYDAEGENLIYCSNYGGTSSATAILGGVATSLQGAYKVDAHGQAMTSEEMRSLLIATGTPQLGDEHIGPMPDLRSAIEHMNPALPSLQPLPFAERPVADALLYCSGYRMPKPRFSLESGMLSIPDSPLFADSDFGGRVIGNPLHDGNIDDLLLLGSVPLDLEFGPVLVEGSEIYYTTDGSQPALCTGQGCGSTRVWTWEDSLQGNHIRITQNDLPMTVLAIMTTDACEGSRPVSELAFASYVAQTDIPAPQIFVGEMIQHQESGVITRGQLDFWTQIGVIDDGELCVRFDFNNAVGSPYIRFTTDGSDPIDTTDGDRPVTSEQASPIWTDANIDQGDCIPIFSVNDPAGTLVTVKAQNFVYLGTGSYVGGTMAVETYILGE